jgi:hypothetical protein
MLKTPQSKIGDLFQIKLYMGRFLSMMLVCEHVSVNNEHEHVTMEKSFNKIFLAT